MAPDPRASAATDPAAYRLWVTENIRFADLDLMGHVNNKAFLTFAESGRLGFLTETRLWVQGESRQNVVARMEIDYRHELLFPGQVRIGTRVLEIGRSSYRVGMGIFGASGCAATVETVLVRVEAATRTKIELNDDERARLRPYLAA